MSNVIQPLSPLFLPKTAPPQSIEEHKSSHNVKDSVAAPSIRLIETFLSSTQGRLTFHFGTNIDLKHNQLTKQNQMPSLPQLCWTVQVLQATLPVYRERTIMKLNPRYKSFSGLGCQNHIQNFANQLQFSSGFFESLGLSLTVLKTLVLIMAGSAIKRN